MNGLLLIVWGVIILLGATAQQALLFGVAFIMLSMVNPEEGS